MEEKKVEKKGPYIENIELFKALNFTKHMIAQGDGEFFAIKKASKFYKVSPQDLSYEYLRFKEWEVQGDSWKDAKDGNSKDPSVKTSNGGEIVF